MSRVFTHSISAALIASGVFLWAFAGRPLVVNPDLDAPLNPLGINGSPYGEVFAMAMQGPIDTYFHSAMSNGGHQHEAGKECAACKTAAATKNENSSPTLERRFENLLTSLDKAVEVSTNPKSPSAAHRQYLRRLTHSSSIGCQR